MMPGTSFLSTVEPTPAARRAALGVALVAVAVFLLVAPFAKTPLQPVPAFLPIYQSALVTFDLVTAVLLWGQFAILRWRALLVLAAGYFFSALMAVAHALSFPGLFAPGGLLSAGGQTTAWLYFQWHAGFPLFFIGYGLLTRRTASLPAARVRGEVLASVLVALALAALFVVLASGRNHVMPPLMAGDTDAPAKVFVAILTWLVAVAALAVLWRKRPRTLLDLWLMVALCAWIADSAMAGVFNHARYDVGWYAGRIFGLLANGFVLVVLLLENGVLYARLAEAKEQLAATNAQLAEASRQKSEFLANMSHELRTPLNAVIGFSEVLKDGLAGELAPEQREYITDIHASGQHLLSLINDILDLSKVESGQMSLDLEPTAAAALFEHSLSIVREKAARKKLRMTLDVPADLGLLQVDVRKAKQVLYNLLSNAVKFSSEGGGVTLRARRVQRSGVTGWHSGAPTVILQPLPEAAFDEYLQIEVEDTGIGIGAGDAPRLFQMFSQLDSSLARGAEGTGLGLVLVERLARLHGGTVALASTPGEGSRFIVWLPWRPVAGEAPAAPPAPGRPSGKGRPVALVIEDNAHAAELMRLQLEPEGFDVVRASDARDALDWLAAREPTVIILDILLPDMDGWDLLALLKKPGTAASHVPVVIVSIVADARKGFSLGASAVLQKPVSRDELLSALADAGVGGRAPPARVLIIDDEPRAVEVLAAFLHGSSYQVLRAYGGAEGIEAARRDRPDLIVLDLMMPGVSGFDVVEVLKDNPETAAIPIVVVTAKTLSPADKEVLDGMVQGVLEKAQFDHTRFVGEVHRAVRLRSEEQV
ncbi:MAG: response regulator [Burkholderiales bacterium]|nr:response regulator [Burkholderiales bacterium]